MSYTFQSNIPPKVVKLWMDHGFFWGGHYSRRYDTMHFEYVGSFGNITTYYKKLTGSSAPAPTPETSLPTLKKGSSGSAVKTAQYALAHHGWSSLATDGVFGDKTRSAVVAFQKAHGLSADGIIGPKTWNKLLAQISQGSAAKQLVRALQVELTAHGHPVTRDGIFGSGTKAAVVAFQKKAGLVPDGVVGMKTWGALID